MKDFDGFMAYQDLMYNHFCIDYIKQINKEDYICKVCAHLYRADQIAIMRTVTQYRNQGSIKIIWNK